jgi:hypothetical protein
MRWGVRDEATDDHQTMTICRDEVMFSVITRNLQIKYSFSPNDVISIESKNEKIFLNFS